MLLAVSARAFMIVKLAGAAYLLFLGIRLLLARPEPVAPLKSGRALVRLFVDGFLVALLNPKTALFFAALLPQFIDPAAAPLGQSLVLGGVFVAIAACTDSLYVFAAAALLRRLSAHAAAQSIGRYLSAATFIGLGAYAALASPKHR